MSWTLTLGNIITIAALLVTAVSVLLTAYSFRSDHSRRRRQATVDYMKGLRAEYRQTWHQINDDSLRPLSTNDAADIYSEPVQKLAIEQMLSIFEHLAASVHFDVFDIKFVNRLSGKFLIQVFSTTRAYIAHARQQQVRWLRDQGSSAQPTKYVEFEALAKTLSTLHEVPFDPIENGVKSA